MATLFSEISCILKFPGIRNSRQQKQVVCESIRPDNFYFHLLSVVIFEPHGAVEETQTAISTHSLQMDERRNKSSLVETCSVNLFPYTRGQRARPRGWKEGESLFCCCCLCVPIMSRYVYKQLFSPGLARQFAASLACNYIPFRICFSESSIRELLPRRMNKRRASRGRHGKACRGTLGAHHRITTESHGER